MSIYTKVTNEWCPTCQDFVRHEERRCVACLWKQWEQAGYRKAETDLLQASIARLTAENEELRARIASLEAELAAAREDAERFRWLRRNGVACEIGGRRGESKP